MSDSFWPPTASRWRSTTRSSADAPSARPVHVRLLETAHRRYGKLPWARLFEPAIRLAENGFAMSPRLNQLLAGEKYLKNDPAAAAYFYDADGTPKAIGTIVRNPEFAATLRAIAAGGADAFYCGPDRGGYRRDGAIAEERRSPRGVGPRRLSRRSGANPSAPNTRHGASAACHRPRRAASRLRRCSGIFTHRNIAVFPPDDAPTLEPRAEAVHLFSEAGRLAFADRGLYVADRDFVPVNVAGLLDPNYLKQRAQLIGPRSMGTAQPGVPPGTAVAWAPDPSPLEAATSHISVVDDNGNAVSMTTTIEDVFGARVMVRGFLLNNQLTDFSFVPSVDGKPVANRVQPGKRPRSSMAPTLVFDRRAERWSRRSARRAARRSLATSPRRWSACSTGTSTSSRRSRCRISVRATVRPSWRRDASAAGVVEALKARGHDIREIDMASGLQGIVRVRLPDGRLGWAGGADPRREGVALGD